MKLEQIKPIALEVWKEIKPFCTVAKIGGSIRREKANCNDIELVILPIDRQARNEIGLFFINSGAKIRKGKFTGRYVAITYKGVKVDLFIPQRHDFYRQLAIRTGSAEYSKKIAINWVKKGYQGTSDGLVLVAKNSELAPEWSSERHFFEWLGMDYLEPKNRY